MNIVIGGSAGQGLVSIGELLARSLVRSGHRIVVTHSYMFLIRSGHDTFVLRVSCEPHTMFTPVFLEDCYRLTRRAFTLAQK